MVQAIDIHLPPQDLQAEKSVLASMLMTESAIDEVADLLIADHFYFDVNAKIYSAIVRLRDAGKKVDIVTVAAELEQRNELADIGGPPYLIECMDAVPHSAHAKYYAEIVRDRSIQRSLIDVGTGMIRDCHESSADTADILTKAERGLFDILEKQESGKSRLIEEIMMATLQKINDRIGKGAISGLSTGFRDLDRQTNGFHAAELVILAARPSMGKTALVCNIAEYVADAGDTTTLIFSLEMSAEELAERFACIRAKLDGHRVRKGLLEKDEQFALVEASQEIARLPLHIDDAPGRTVGQISAICRRLKRRNKLGLVIIDYLQLIETEDKRANREQQIAQITRRLKGIAKENKIPVIALSQLNRNLDNREDKRPRLSDLRESGAIEQDADIVLFLHRPDAYNKDDQPGLAEVIVAKHRSGPTGIVNLTWRKESMRFDDFDPIEDPAETAARNF